MMKISHFSVLRHQLPKLRAAGSSPVYRSQTTDSTTACYKNFTGFGQDIRLSRSQYFMWIYRRNPSLVRHPFCQGMAS